MRNLLIALLAFASLMAMALPTQAVPVTQDQFNTVCGKNAGTGIDDPSTPYEYCYVKCGLNGEHVCLFKCTASGCTGTVVFAEVDDSDEPKHPNRFGQVLGVAPGSLSAASDSSADTGGAKPMPTIY